MDKNARIRIGIATLLIAALVTTLALHFTAAQSPSVSSGYTIDGDSVYWEVADKGRITVSPHTTHGSWSTMRYQTIEFESYLGSDEEITCGLAFNEKPIEYGLSLQKDHVVQYPVWDEPPTNETNGTIIGYEDVTESYWQDVTSQLTTGNRDSKFFGYGTFTVPANGKKVFQVKYLLSESDPVDENGRKKWEMRCWQGSFTSPTWEINLDPWADNITCIAYYTFDNNQTNTTHAQNWQNCTLGDATIFTTTTGVEGKFGQAFQFSGGSSTDKVVSISNASLIGAATNTLGGWVNYSAITDNMDWAAVGLATDAINSRIMGNIMSNNVRYNTGSQTCQASGVTIAVGNYYHIVFVTENIGGGNTAVSIYINGTNVTSCVHSALNLQDSTLKFGTNGEVTGHANFSGQLDDVFLFADALTPEQVAAIYANGTASLWSAPPGNANESAGRTAIESGISASSASSGTTYTDRQMYIYYLNGTQKLGTFDKVLSEGNQRWLFNYNTTGEDYTGMESIAPTIHVWENTSLTASQITAQVSGFINATNT